MHWNVDEDDPPMMGEGYTVTVDGEPVEHVVELDTDAGYVVKYCQGEKGEDHAAKAHRDPEDDMEVCLVRREGYVEVVAPNGARLG